MLVKFLQKHCDGRITARAYKISDAIDTVWLFLCLFLAMGVVGSIESGKWFG